MVTRSRKRFDELRARYLARKAQLDAQEVALHSRYGRDPADSWLSAGEQKTRERLRGAVGKAGDAFSAYLASISPRDWSYGVPAHWLYEKLPFEDAVRPTTEKLSCVPPLSYGASTART